MKQPKRKAHKCARCGGRHYWFQSYDACRKEGNAQK